MPSLRELFKPNNKQEDKNVSPANIEEAHTPTVSPPAVVKQSGGIKLNLSSGKSPVPVSTGPSQKQETQSTASVIDSASYGDFILSTPAGAVDNSLMVAPNADEIAKFKQATEIVRSAFDKPEQIANAIRTIMLMLRNNPDFESVLQYEDIQMMVRALRQSTGQYATSVVLGASKKQAKSKKTNTDAAELTALLGGKLDLGL